MIELAEIEAARDRITGAAVRTPLLRLRVDAPADIYLKLENLQPIGSFKIRGATNAVLLAPASDRAAHATPWAMFPAEAVSTPRRSCSSDRRAMALAAPRILNEPIGWRFSSLR